MKSAAGALVLLSLGSFLYAQSWDIPRGAASEKGPLSPTPAVLDKGKARFTTRIARGVMAPTGKVMDQTKQMILRIDRRI